MNSTYKLLLEIYENSIQEAQRGRGKLVSYTPQQEQEIVDWYTDMSGDRASVEEIAQMYGVTPRTLHHVLDRLRAKGYNIPARYKKAPTGAVPREPKLPKFNSPKLIPYDWTPEEIKDIVYRYKGGDIPENIGKDYGVSSTTISNLLRKNGIETRSNRIQWTPEQIEDISNQYIQGTSPQKIAKQYGVSGTAIKRVLALADVPLRGHDYASFRKGVDVELDPDEIDKRRYGYEYTSGVTGYNPDTIYMQSPSGEVEEINANDVDELEQLEMQGWRQINPKRSNYDLSDISDTDN